MARDPFFLLQLCFDEIILIAFQCPTEHIPVWPPQQDDQAPVQGHCDAPIDLSAHKTKQGRKKGVTLWTPNTAVDVFLFLFYWYFSFRSCFFFVSDN